MSETPLYKKAIDWALAHGFCAWRQNNGRRGRVKFGFTGQPDVCGFHSRTGQALFIECKIEGKKLTTEQWFFMRDANASGCLVRVFTEKNIYALYQVPIIMTPRGLP